MTNILLIGAVLCLVVALYLARNYRIVRRLQPLGVSTATSALDKLKQAHSKLETLRDSFALAKADTNAVHQDLDALHASIGS